MAEIDVEDENILTSIFKDSFPESWQENHDFVQYLMELSSYGAERLAREPERLAEEKAQILAETQDLAFHNYTTFIQTANCSKEIFQDFQIIEQSVNNLLNKLPGFSNECGNVIQKAQEISSSRRMNTLTLQRHTQLLEILEIPQLMDTCVRNGYYEEALELAAHVKRLEKKHPNIQVIASIVQEVKVSSQLMLNNLIQQLRTNLQLPACLRVIGFLRRMDVFTEAELRIKFLQARDSWLQSILDSIPKGDAYTHITSTIESSRVHLFDIMTQFRAIFSDEDPLISMGKEEAVNESLIFHSWVLQKISQFLVTLENDLEEGIGGRLDSILGQCMYFGLSFSRVGADFRGLIAPLFERAGLKYFVAALKEANKKYEENMQSFNLLGLTTTGGLPFGMAASQSGQLYPPTTLLDFYPLAAYCNHVLTAFNDLRLCAPLALACQIATELQKSLLDVNRVILAFHRAEETTFNAKEKDQFEQFCATYATDLLPFLNKCLQSLFPPSHVANALGISVSELNKQGGTAQLDVPAVLACVDHLMPVVPPPPDSEPEKPVTFIINSDDEDSPVPASLQSPPAPATSTAAIVATTTSQPAAEVNPIPPSQVDTSASPVSPVELTETSAALPSSVSDFPDDDASAVSAEVNTYSDILASSGSSIPEELPPPISEAKNSADAEPKHQGDLVASQIKSEESLVSIEDQPGTIISTLGQGDWDNQGFDLDNLDEITLEGSDSAIDLDTWPMPVGAETKIEDS